MLASRSAAVLVATALGCTASAQESTAYFDAPVLVGDHQTRFQKLGDLDGDGFMDAFSAWWLSSSQSQFRVAAWRNDGAGKLERTWSRSASISPSGTSAWAFATGDVDANGLDDFVLSGGRILTLMLSEPGGGSTPFTPTWNTGGPLITGIALLELDGDPYAEIAIVHGDLTILGYDWQTTTWLAPYATLPLGAVNGEALAAELDGDGQEDLLVWDATRVLIVPMTAGLPQSPITFVHGLADPRAQAGDVDGDGDVDVVVFDVGHYVRLRRVGPASFVQEGPFPGGPARYLYDVDRDGDLDGVCCGGGGGGGSSPVANVAPGIFRLALNDGAGNFAPAIEFQGLGSERLAGAADLDHDGDLDLVAGRCVYYAPDAHLSSLPRAIAASAVAGASFGDLDGDADPDVAPGLAMLRNPGDGAYQPHSPLVPDAPPGTEYHGNGYPGDFDGDGDLDLVVRVRASGGGAFQEMRLLRNSGGGTYVDGGPAGAPGVDFTYPVHTSGPQASHVLAKDADGDGDVDLVVRALPSQVQTKIYWNDGQGSFSPGPAWANEVMLHVVDLNGNGVPELIGWRRYSSGNSDLYYWGGLGGGTFNGGQVLDAVSTNPLLDLVDVGDADGDGDPDIVGTEQRGAYMLRNTGLLGGWPVQFEIYDDQFSSGAGPFGALLTDFDGDALLDVISWPASTSTGNAPGAVSLVRRRSDNSGYEPPVAQILRPTLRVDVDGDGDEDVAGTTLYKSRRHHGLEGGVRRQLSDGVAGAGGIVPTLGASGPFRVGLSAELRLTGMTGGATGEVAVSYVSDQAPLFGGGAPHQAAVRVRIISQLDVLASGTPGAIGEGRWSLPYTVPAYAAGRTKRYRATLDDPWSPSGGSMSNTLLITYGP